MTNAATESEPTVRPHGYRAVWRWHFYAGLLVAPVLLVLAITGALYLFDREIDGWWNRDIQTVAAQGRTLSLFDQERAVRAAFPGAVPQRVRVPHDAGQASVWNMRLPNGAGRDVFLNPHTGVVTGSIDPGSTPMAIVRDLHGNLMTGDTGSYFVELTACWTLVMMVTGIWLWWPRRWKAKGVFVPRLSATGRRFWRDLHAIPSLFNAVFVILLVMTGLPWSVFWGAQFASLGETIPFIAPSPNFRSPPAADGATGTADPHAMHRAAPLTGNGSDPDTGKIPWAIQHSPVPSAAPEPEHMGHDMAHMHHSEAQSAARGANIADMEALLPRLNQQIWGGGVRIFYPRDASSVFMISYVPDKAEGQRTIYVDPASRRIIGSYGWAEYSPVAKAVEWGVMTHMGRQYGLANQLANLAVCLVLIGGVVAGLTAWWKRRPAGEVGAPQLEHGERLPRVMLGLLIVLGILFPLVGLTMLPLALWSVRPWQRRRQS